MLYIDTKKASADLYIPRNGWWVSGPVGLHLALKNTVTGEVLDFPITAARPFGFMAFLTVSIPAGFTTGEWHYRLLMGFDTVAQGLAVGIDGDKARPVEYKADNTTIQYNG